MTKYLIFGGVALILVFGGFFFMGGDEMLKRWRLAIMGQHEEVILGIGKNSDISSSFSITPEPFTLTPHTVTFFNGEEAELMVPEGFSVAVSAEDLGKARFMTMSPDGRMFLPDMVDYNLSREGRVLILSDFNEETKQFEQTDTYLSNLRGPNNVAFYTDEEGSDWLYLTLTEHLLRYPYREGDTEPSGAPEVVYRFPNEQSEGADGVVWHITRTILFVDDTLFVSIGSGCNLCEEKKDEDRAVILTMNPDGTEAEVYAEGLKNAVGMEWAYDALYATENGVDHLGPDAPSDVLYRVEKGKHYGWPYCYESEGKVETDNSLEWAREPVQCALVPRALSAFSPHSAPLDIKYFNTDAHPLFKNSFLVAMQGSWDKTLGKGYSVKRVKTNGEWEVLIDGFLDKDGERVGRPVGILQHTENSFFVTDDFNGRMFYVFEE